MKKITFLLTCIGIALFTNAQIPTNGLIGYWSFSGNANDESGNGHNGTVNGATLTTDRFGNPNSAYQFDGINDYIDCGTSTDLSLNNISISVWYLEETVGYHTIVSKSTEAVGEIGYRVESQSDNLSYFIWSRIGIIQAGTGYVVSPTVSPIGIWHHLVGVKSGDTLKIYRDNELLGSTSGITAAFNTNNSLNIGCATGNTLLSFFNGKIDDVRIYDRALTTNEVSNIYQYNSDLIVESDTSICPGTPITLHTSYSSSGGCFNITPGMLVVPTEYSTIQAAIDSAVNGDTVLVLSGTYSGTGNRNLQITDKSIKLFSRCGPDSTIIDCGNTTRALTVNSGTSIISGFTVINGYEKAFTDWSNANIVQLYKPTLLRNMVFKNCSIASGYISTGGAFFSGDSITIENCLIYNNTIVGGSSSSGSNFGSSGTAVMIRGGGHQIKNTIYYGNTLTAYHKTLFWSETLPVNIQNSIIFGNSINLSYNNSVSTMNNLPIYSCIQGAYTGTGNISTDPLFTNPTSGDFSLQSSSPCIGTGLNGADMGYSAPTNLSYLWSTGETTSSITVAPLQTTTYSLSVTSSGSTTNDSVKITVPQINDIGQGGTVNLSNGLVGYWPFNGNVNDESGNGHNGTLNGGSVLTTDRFGNPNSAYYFDGIDDYIHIVNSTLVTGSGLTASVWVKDEDTSPTNYGNIINTGNQNDYAIYADSINKVGFTVNFTYGSGSTVGFNHSSLVNMTGWNNYVLVFNGMVLKGYINGQLLDSTSCIGSIGTTPQLDNLSFGCYTNNAVPIAGSYFLGKIDDIRLFNKTLDSTEISMLANEGNTLSVTLNNDTICNNSNVQLTISNSQTGVSYQPFINGSNAGTPQTGTGDTLTFVFNSLSYVIGNNELTITATDTATGCSISLDTTLNIFVLTSANITNYTSICDGQSLTVGPHTYTTSGTYLDTLLSISGCDSIITTNLTINPIPTLNLGNDTSICANASITLSAGSSGNLYHWSNGLNSSSITVSTSGNFAVTVTNSFGCIATDNINISMYTPINITVNTVNTACGQQNGIASAFVTGGTSPYSYLWNAGDTTNTAINLNAGVYIVYVTDANHCQSSGLGAVSTTNGPVISNTPQITNVSCFGGSNGAISITVTGGLQPYHFEWSNGDTINQSISNLTAGPYEIVVTDANNCQAVRSINVTQPTQISIATSSTNATCGNADGIVTTSVTGGTQPYSYNWNNGIQTSNLTSQVAGVYTVTVTDSHSCIMTASVAISETGAATVVVDSVVNSSCGSNNGAVYISVSGGAGFTYSWSDLSTSQDLTGVAAGNYSVTVTSGGCNAIAHATITEIQPLLQPICIVSVDIVGNSSKNMVVWEKQQTSGISHYKIWKETTQTGVYQVVATIPYAAMSKWTDPNSNPHQRSWRYKISSVDSCGTESPLSNVHKTIHLTVNLGQGQDINLIWNHYEGFEYFTYFIHRYRPSTGWVLIDSIPGDMNTYTDTPLGGGSVKYKVAAKRDNECWSSGNSKEMSGPYSQSLSNIEDNGIIDVSVNESSANNIECNLYPNPVKNELTIDIYGSKTNQKIEIYNFVGQVIFKSNVNKKAIINTSNLPSGIYLVKLYDENLTIVKRFVKE